MKKIILSLAAAVFAVSAFAHDSAKQKKTPEEMANKKADKLKTELSLTDDQRSKVYSAVLDKINKVSAVKARYKDSASRKKGMGKEIKVINDAFDDKMDQILNADQKVKYEALKKERKDKAKEKQKDKKAKSDKKNKSKSESKGHKPK